MAVQVGAAPPWGHQKPHDERGSASAAQGCCRRGWDSGVGQGSDDQVGATEKPKTACRCEIGRPFHRRPALDEAWKRLGAKSRIGFIRAALAEKLQAAGEEEVAGLIG